MALVAILTQRRGRSIKLVYLCVACFVSGRWSALEHRLQIVTPYEDNLVVVLLQARDIHAPEIWLEKSPLLSNGRPRFQLYFYLISGLYPGWEGQIYET